jgi:hypothetical protein
LSIPANRGGGVSLRANLHEHIFRLSPSAEVFRPYCVGICRKSSIFVAKKNLCSNHLCQTFKTHKLYELENIITKQQADIAL